MLSASRLASSGVRHLRASTVWGLFRRDDGGEAAFEAGVVADGAATVVRATREVLIPHVQAGGTARILIALV